MGLSHASMGVFRLSCAPLAMTFCDNVRYPTPFISEQARASKGVMRWQCNMNGVRSSICDSEERCDDQSFLTWTYCLCGTRLPCQD